ncbi:hypothetical protein RHMOL_Rhmol10G0219400 [Rhododendron molle]|uniref:Uncharacterized protein n=1 Tax=Rhododendron molle TaxID=49168 RepID=A0ACC0M5Y9_RHOML|nr:hypothetical protein RHMOL_Rhmol10G0219400 [Rhododendron molle]
MIQHRSESCAEYLWKDVHLVAYLVQLSSNSDDIPYVLLVVEAEEFCNLVINDTLMQHVSCVRSRYPSHTICYVTNRLMAYINKSFPPWNISTYEKLVQCLPGTRVRVQLIKEETAAEVYVISSMQGPSNLPDGSSIRKSVTPAPQFDISGNTSHAPRSSLDHAMTFQEWVIIQKAESERETNQGDMHIARGNQIERPRLGRERDRDSEQEQTIWTKGDQGQEG